MTEKTIVFKIGGSLLSLPDLGRRIGDVVAQRTDAMPLIVVGGGPTADLVRQWDWLHSLGEERAHWLALRSLALNEALLAELLPGASLVTNRNEALAAHRAGHVPVLSAHNFVRVEESEETHLEQRLPHTWDVTSDSIAAWIAQRWPAEEIVLVKSRPVPKKVVKVTRNADPPVDGYFRRLAPKLARIGWVNLRATNPRIERWRM